MQIIKDRNIIEDSWQFIADEHPLLPGDCTVTLERWLKEKEQLLRHDGKVGVRIESTDNLEILSGDLALIPLVEVNFVIFSDGRAFSKAWLLKNRYQFTGEIRAVGNFLADQIFYLSRSGFNAFNFEGNQNLTLAISMLNDFSVSYQKPANQF
ncbi:MAG: DUF934 domain-containing protein [Methylicorpusculum sp.]|uniref:DUF934 domain-containing protein n=1 Tax=Methylicorpusculum sp. TaxID=2713644 RepID=UPI002722F06B|nr:DUF934 domain-containing protein [Methylicorpusculum sp.]MDO8938660.1 DUF934 domain-containing protein [Methylicorpusculum sp.]MDO9241764.1 DUF934 domain-containing protein [Methylicorpusculum sp.]MDP2200447.1 DUF934 domain-containing protein [Methylicorpusculum sp.]